MEVEMKKKPKERDSRFAEKFANLRHSRGLTQEFIAMKLKISDGAVSKWENGESKPKAGRAAAVASLLGVDVNMLLDDDALTLEESYEIRKKRREEVWKKAKKQAFELYGKFPPLQVLSRWDQEKNMLEEKDAVIMFDILGEVRKAARNRRMIFGAPIPECFVAWLLGATIVNPLEPHLRCPECKKTVMHPEVRSGMDLPETFCECGARMIPDGQNIPFGLSACSFGGNFDFYRCETDPRFMEEAENIILSYGEKYWDMEITRHRESIEPERDPEGNIVHDPETGKKIIAHYMPMSFLMFGRKKKSSVRKPERISGPMNVDYWGRRPGQPTIVLMSGYDGPNYLCPPDNFPGTADELTRQEVIERALKDYWDWLPVMDEIRGEVIPPDLDRYRGKLNFSKFVDLICSVECLYLGNGPQELADRLGVEDLLDLPYSEIDLWNMITARMPCPGTLTGILQRVIDKTATGTYHGNGIKEIDRIIFRELNLPEWFEGYTKDIYHVPYRSPYIDLGLRMLEDARRKIRDKR